MRKYLCLIILFILAYTINVSANIMCNDGSESPTCSDCHQGCCSWHGGCASSSSYYDNESTIDWGPVLTIGAGITGGAIYMHNKKSK